MSIKRRVKEDLRAGKPWPLIYKEYRSKSQIYEGLMEWFGEVEEEILAKQSEVVRLDTAVEDLNQKLKAASSEHSELLKENEGLKEEIEQNRQQLTELTQRLEALEKQVEDRQTRLGELNSKIEGLASKGVTLETVQKIHAAEFESGEDLLSWVQTAKERAKLRKDVEGLTSKKVKLEKAVENLKKTSADLREEIKSEENRLDSLKNEHALYRTAINAVLKLFKEGYNTEDILQLSIGLKIMGVKGDPKMPLKRLVEGLKRAKSLEILKEEKEETEKELEAIRRDLNAAKAELASIQKTTLKILKEAGESALAEIEKTREKATAEITRVRAEFEENLRRWGELQRQIGEVRDQIDMAKAFMAFMYEDEILEKFSASFVSALMYRVALWIAKKHPQAKSKPPDDMGGLDSHKYYGLGDVAVFLAWALLQLTCS